VGVVAVAGHGEIVGQEEWPDLGPLGKLDALTVARLTGAKGKELLTDVLQEKGRVGQ